MGISIFASADTALVGDVSVAIIAVSLACDACHGVETFTHKDGYIGSHAAAMRAGWLERQGEEGRIWLCPACSGKV